ncbi:ribosome small subunit-dependent GTPase A [Microbulbifer agarilyticus]|uniref:ribosome small subunit-dependent GTPase A n=1 Tax=Microbulbifer agarilyticus TaxID=260552 RepID=UPI001CD1DE78|nr:ribosome small subunit-dependent GTPase A [Microbulbifer agarilyticus]MCA0899509.1 ribosome small subunit-dependent GTPase A [Microbulbifer agarilyticus]
MSKSLISRRPTFRRGASAAGAKIPATSVSPLQQLGWKPFFQQQLSLDELNNCQPVKVMAVHRSQIEVSGESGEESVLVSGALFEDAAERPTVGDWLLLARDSRKPVRRLERSSLFKRMAPGAKQVQLIAANVDNVLIVSSCNQDFNLSRVERYLALVKEAGCRACLVLTKADLDENHDRFHEALKGHSDLPVELINALDSASVAPLREYCQSGETLALLGSSGVGKSTLLNSLAGTELAATGGIREDDSKGRHTTRHRALYPIVDGGLILDSPGMRELALADIREGLEATFADITALSDKCRFADCAHESEPGCAVQRAIDTGELDARRLHNWRKLEREVARNSKTLAESRAADRSLSQLYRSVQNHARANKNRT